MHLDVYTLLFAEAFVSVLSAGFLVLAWSYYRETTAALYWAAGNIAIAGGVVVLELNEVIPPAWMAFATGLFLLSAGLFWGGARRFDKQPAYVFVTAAGLAIWIAIGMIPEVAGSPRVGALVGHSLISLYAILTAWEIWHDGDERLFSRWPLVGLFCLRGLLFGIAFFDVLLGAPVTPEPDLDGFFALVNFEHFIFTIGTTIFLIAMMKERHELRHKTAATYDSLTGLTNRGAFLERADAILQRHQADNAPFAVLVFDIDNFKSVNDSHGHATGDRVLETFGSVVRRCVRADDLVGRLGGEEFGVVLHRADEDVGFAFAERIRKAFRDTCAQTGNIPVAVTTSVGVATFRESGETVSDLLRQADNALYRAKATGRNRTSLASRRTVVDDPVVVRIA